jgi:putative nucleotidyltransferase with HDIG domain
MEEKMKHFEDIPAREQIIEFVREKGLSEDKITHSIAVTDLALRIADEISQKGIVIDKQIVEAGGLLHDVGIATFGDRDYEAEMAEPIPEHCSIGANLALEAGFPESVAHCIEAHECWLGNEAKACRFPDPVKEDYIPKTWEAKAVAYADIVVFAAVEEGYDLWKDPDAVVKTYYAYFSKCFKNATGENIEKDHPSVQRINELHKEMFQYLKPEYIPKPWREFKKQSL